MMVFTTLVLWIATYCLITKSKSIKSKIKLFLRVNFNDKDEKLWAISVSCLYIFLPFLSLFFVDISFLGTFFSFGDQPILILITSIIGFFASLTITTLILDLGLLVKNLDYKRMEKVNWMNQVKKINPIFGIGAALSEELFLRFLIPSIILYYSNNFSLFILSLIISSLIFVSLQIFYVEEPLQRFVKFIAGISISIVSVLLIVLSYSIIPSLIMHGSYVLFFLTQDKANHKTLTHNI